MILFIDSLNDYIGTGGLSGAPLMKASTEVVRDMYIRTHGNYHIHPISIGRSSFVLL
jgi:dihydroorotate dehydrogenase